MNIYIYAITTYALTAVIALSMVGVIVLIDKLMIKLNIKDDE